MTYTKKNLKEDYYLTVSDLQDKYSPNGNGQHPKYTRSDWREEVAADNTLRGYWDWVEAQISEAIND